MYKNLTPVIIKNLNKSNFEKTINFNSHGFRGSEIDTNKKNILIAGCSIYYCTGVDDPSIFPNLLLQRLGDDYGYLNVSMPGTGLGSQIKNINWALSNFKFEKLLWLGSHPIRGLCYHEQQGIMNYIPETSIFNNAWFQTNQGKTWIDNRIGNDYNTMCQITDATETLFMLLKTLNIDTYVRNWDIKYNKDFLTPLRNTFNFKSLPFFSSHDKAADNIHPGIISHRVHADKLAELIC